MEDLLYKIDQAAEYVQNRLNPNTDITLILGTGLSGLLDKVEVLASVSYSEIPFFPQSTVQTHENRLIKACLEGKEILIMAGRHHYYEGYAAKEIAFPIRVLKTIGIEKIVMTNISGGLNPSFEAGDLVMVEDHINFLPDNPLRGINYEELGPRFPDFSEPYCPKLAEIAMNEAKNLRINLHKGVYLALQGPNLETKAEYKLFHLIGADLLGMSTVPEVITAVHMDMKVLLISMISNKCYPPENIKKTSVEEIIALVQSKSDSFTRFIGSVIPKI